MHESGATRRARLLTDGELAWVYGPRRHELATVAHRRQASAVGDVVAARHRWRRAVRDRSRRQARPRQPRTPSAEYRARLRKLPRGATQAHERSTSPPSRSTRGTERARSGHAGRHAALSVGQLRSGDRHRARSSLSALRQLAERRDRASAHGRARGRRGGGAAVERHGRDRVRAARAAPPGRPPARELVDLRRRHRAPHARSSPRSASTYRSSIRWTRASGASSMRKETRAIFLESPVNPTCRVLDLRPVSYITKETGIALVVDSTFASPDQLPPARARRGRRHSLGDEISERASRRAGRRRLRNDLVHRRSSAEDDSVGPGARIRSPAGCSSAASRRWTFACSRHNENAMQIAEWCAARKEIKRVHYPGLPIHPDHESP